MHQRSLRQRQGLALAVLLAIDVTGPPRAAGGGLMGLEDARRLIKAGHYAQAEAVARDLLHEAEASHGPESPQVAEVLDELVEALFRGGKTQEPQTRELAERAAAIKETALGPDRVELAKSLSNLGTVLRRTGDHSGARSQYERAFAIREHALGSDHAEVARSLNDLGVLHAETGDYPKARALYDRALSIYEKADGLDNPSGANVLNNVGILSLDMGDYDGARRALERTVAIRESVLGPDHPDVALSLNNLALVLSEKGDPAGARPLCERAIGIWEKAVGPEHPDVAKALNNLGMLEHRLGNYAAARPLYERAVGIWEKAGSSDLGLGLNNLSQLWADEGDLGKAISVLQRALSFWEKTFGPEHPSVAIGLGNLGALSKDAGDYSNSRAFYERALAIQEKRWGNDHPDLGYVLTNLGILLTATGDYAGARPLFERALGLRQRALGPDHPNVSESLHYLAALSDDVGDTVGARALYERALAIRQKAFGPDNFQTAKTLLSLGLLQKRAGDLEGARRHLEGALAAREKALGPQHPDVASSLASLAELRAAMGKAAAARSLLERALAIREKALGVEHPDVASVLVQLSELFAEGGQRTQALELALRAEAIGANHLRLTVRTLPERQALSYASVRPSALNLALSLVAQDLDSPLRVRVWEALIRSRALVLDEMAGRNRAVGAAGDPELRRLTQDLTSAGARLARLTVRGPEDTPEVYRRLLTEAREDRESIERRVAERSASFREEQARLHLVLRDVAAALPPDGGLVAWARYDQKGPGGDAAKALPTAGGKVKSVASYLAFVLPPGQDEPQVVPLGDAGEIDALVSRWSAEVRSGIAGSQAAAEATYRRAGEALRRKVWDPVAAQLAGAHRVFIVPDGNLHLVSFAALPTERGRYLVETGPLLHFLSAERDMLSSEAARPAPKGLLALGGPAFDEPRLFSALRPAQKGTQEWRDSQEAPSAFRGSRSGCRDFQSLRFQPLPAAAREAEAVARLWRESGQASGVEVLEGTAANEGAFKARAAGHRVLHLATHAFFLTERCASPSLGSRGIGGLVAEEPRTAKEENPLWLAGLVLAGANHRMAADPHEEDGILTAEEIAALDLSSVEWAVLSACDTGGGAVRAGEGVFGLRRSFQAAGVRTLLMSLWPVADEAARTWMEALYEGRLLEHLGTAEAVRQASLTLLRRRRARHQSTHPFFWAGFVAAGDWR